MKTYTKFIINKFMRSLIFVISIIFSLVFLLNLLNELEFFRNKNLSHYYLFYLSFLNAPSLIIEILPFIFLVSTQIFFTELFKDNQIQIFKYYGLKNTKIIYIVSIFSIFLGIISIIFVYNFSSNLKNFYLNLKSNYTTDDKYLAVITKNGLWIKDKLDDKILIVNSLELKNNLLISTLITEFDKNYEILRHIKSEKINIKNNEWIVYKPQIFIDNATTYEDSIIIKSNFNYEKIQSLFSNLTSLSIFQLFELKKNYMLLGYSTTEIQIYIYKLFTYPLYLFLIVIFSSAIMLNFKNTKSNIFKISLGLFFSVIIYYINNFFYVLGNTEKISTHLGIFIPLLLLTLLNIIITNKINEK
jgi:lipopolysaccharide export system permease protein